jgi:hypothetical protein
LRAAIGATVGSSDKTLTGNSHPKEKSLSSEGSPEDPVARSSRRWLEELPSWATKLVTIGALPEDDEDERLRKASLVLTATMITLMATVWVVVYASFGL